MRENIQLDFNFHGWVERTGLDWVIVCLVEIGRWNFSKQPFFFFIWLHENLKTLKITSRSNKGDLSVEISGYHNGAKRGCLQVPIEVKTGDWACEFFFGLGKEARRGCLKVPV